MRLTAFSILEMESDNLTTEQILDRFLTVCAFYVLSVFLECSSFRVLQLWLLCLLFAVLLVQF